MSLYSLKQAGAAAVQEWTTTLPLGKGVFDYYDSLGDLTITADYVVPSVLDGPMVVRRANNLTINAATQNVTVTTQNRCRGLIWLLDGNLTLQRSASYVASMSMTARGARGSSMMGNYDVLFPDSITLSGKKILQRDALALLKSQGFAIIDRWMWDEWGKYLGVSATAWAGGQVLLSAAGCGARRIASGSGNAGANGGTGSGAMGAPNTGSPGLGGSGRPWGGGTGTAGTAYPPPDGDDYGGAGGPCHSADTAYGGGAGNPGGAGGFSPGSDGTGGLLIIIVKGNINVGAGCIIQADGMPGGNATTGGTGGGGSGGGHVSIIYGGTHTNSGTERANGGAGGTGPVANGGAGGAGSVVTKTFAQMGWT